MMHICTILNPDNLNPLPLTLMHVRMMHVCMTHISMVFDPDVHTYDACINDP